MLSQREAARPRPPSGVVPTTSVVIDGPRIVFRNATLDTDLGRVAAVALDDPGGARALDDLVCDRVFVAGGRTLCLASDPGLVTRYTATVREESGAVRTLPLTGNPSRARLSRDGRLAATTSFVSGDSYASASFSTRTVISDLDTGASLDLETFTLVDGGRRVAPVDRNYWGVTFAADGDRFFVTVAFGGATRLAEGRLSTRSIRTLRRDAECPSLSPDGTRVAYKKRGDRAPGDWRLVVLDLATGTETQLAETRSVDDQVEWLDDERIVYGMPGEGTRAAETNVWTVPADGSGAPTLLVANAWSPAVVGD